VETVNQDVVEERRVRRSERSRSRTGVKTATTASQRSQSQKITDDNDLLPFSKRIAIPTSFQEYEKLEKGRTGIIRVSAGGKKTKRKKNNSHFSALSGRYY